MSDEARKPDDPAKPESTQPHKPRISAAPPPVNKMPLIAAAVALIALAGVFAIFKVHKDGQTGVIEPASPAKPPAAKAETGEATAPVAATRTPAAVRTPAAPVAPAATAEPHAEPLVGDVFEGLITGLGSRGDGRLRLEGNTVYITGAKEGETVRYRITQQLDRFWTGELVAADTPLTQLLKSDKPAAAEAPTIEPAKDLPAGVLDGVTSTAEQVQVGTVFSVVITDRDRYNPDKNGFCRIGGFAVIVADTQPGTERVKIRITERHERRADAVIVAD